MLFKSTTVSNSNKTFVNAINYRLSQYCQQWNDSARDCFADKVNSKGYGHVAAHKGKFNFSSAFWNQQWRQTDDFRGWRATHSSALTQKPASTTTAICVKATYPIIHCVDGSSMGGCRGCDRLSALTVLHPEYLYPSSETATVCIEKAMELGKICETCDVVGHSSTDIGTKNCSQN